MTTELENKLVIKYPHFFDYLKDYTGPIIPIQFGFECDDGWYVILDALMDEITNHINCINDRTIIKNKFYRWLFTPCNSLHNFLDCRKSTRKISKLLYKLRNKIEPKYIKGPQLSVDVTQIKEKFSGIRFYYNGGDDVISGMVYLAENLSYRTCELCGSTENVTQSKGGWIYTRCEKCINKI